MKESEMYVSPETKVFQLVSEEFLCISYLRDISGYAEDSDDVLLF